MPVERFLLDIITILVDIIIMSSDKEEGWEFAAIGLCPDGAGSLAGRGTPRIGDESLVCYRIGIKH